MVTTVEEGTEAGVVHVVVEEEVVGGAEVELDRVDD